MKEWRLDPSKYVVFGLDGATIMVGSKIGVAAYLRHKINPFVIFIHCVAHRNNLTTLDAAKAHVCKDRLKYIDDVANDVATYFKKLS